jgi:hypothetical protein
MLLTELNLDDRAKLMEFRIERLLQFFTSSLPHCLLQIDGDNMLTVYCFHLEIVDDLLDELEDLCSHARLIIGVSAISVHFGLEEIVCAKI